MELGNNALVASYEGQSRRRLSHLWLSANTEMLRTACFLCVIDHREWLRELESLVARLVALSEQQVLDVEEVAPHSLPKC